MEFRKIEERDYNATLEKWVSEAEANDLFPHEVKSKLGWIVETLRDQGRQSHKQLAYGVFAPDSNVAIAVCDLVLTDRGALAGRWLKMLKVTLAPELEFALQEEDLRAMTIAVNAYRNAVLGTFAERLNHEADTLKLYGRTDEMLRFLMLLLVTINDDNDLKLSARKEGRWLVINSQE